MRYFFTLFQLNEVVSKYPVKKKRNNVTIGSETYAVFGLFFSCLAFGGMNVETQLRSPTESALRHECIIHSYAPKGLSVWQ
jgi:hypothetical protein